MKLLAMIFVTLSTASFLGAQPLTGQAEKDQKPVPYSKDEFPRWLTEVGRSTTIFVGSFPFSFLLTSLTFTFVEMANPHFFKDEEQKIYTQLGTSAILSLGVTLIDGLIRLSAVEPKKKESQQERAQQEKPSEILHEET